MKRERAFTLVELMVSVSILGILSTVLFAIFYLGGRAWLSTSVRSEMQGELHVVLKSLSKEAERSVFSSLTVEPEALSFLSALGPTGQFEFTPEGEPIWQKYVIFYRDPASMEIRREEFDITPRFDPLPIETYDDGGGPRALSTYLGDGRVIARGAVTFNPLSPTPGNLQVEIGLQRSQSQNRQPALFELSTTIRFRNP